MTGFGRFAFPGTAGPLLGDGSAPLWASFPAKKLRLPSMPHRRDHRHLIYFIRLSICSRSALLGQERKSLHKIRMSAHFRITYTNDQKYTDVSMGSVQ